MLGPRASSLSRRSFLGASAAGVTLLVESHAGTKALKGVFFLDEPLTDQARLVLDGGTAALAAKVSAAVVARRRVVVHVGEGT